MPSIIKVKHWYAQSFEVCFFPSTHGASFSPPATQLTAGFFPSPQELITFPKPKLTDQIRQALNAPHPTGFQLPEATPNPAIHKLIPPGTGTSIQNRTKLRIPMERRYSGGSHAIRPRIYDRRYYAHTGEVDWPPDVHDYNARFTKVLENIKRRHDPTVTTVAQGMLEWKRSQNEKEIGMGLQGWLDRFYMSRIGIRFLLGQRELLFFSFRGWWWCGLGLFLMISFNA
jgi:pyruvate dehydrogenase kinase 2/3/4